MSILAPQTKAPILDQDGVKLGASGLNTHSVNSSDPTVVDIQWLDWRPWAFARKVGSVTLTATRLADGATTTLDVEVVAPALPPFSISLGEAVPF